LLGALWNWSLYGVLVVQLYVYSYNFPGDRTLLKLLVYSVFLIETLQTALTGADLYYWLVSGFGNVERLTFPHLSGFDVPIIEAIVSLVVQFFFAYRIWVLSGRRRSSWFLIVCVIICLVSLSCQSRAYTSLPYFSVLYYCRSNCVLWGCICRSYMSQAIPIWLTSVGVP
ncbi:hypothetical protein EDB83DRAFT_2221234, partial [Lactarius deliciosus]